jgi:molybdate/tungstate transport system ATP-binding protein
LPDAFSAVKVGLLTEEESNVIELENIHIDVPGFSVRDINLSVNEGEFFALLGPTGAGKTLLLEAISGLVPINNGRITIGKREVTYLPPEKRRIGIVYQDQALFPHLTVKKNISYGLSYSNMDGKKVREYLEKLLNQLELNHLLKRSIHRLSGGERQRVALARALVVRPSVLLLDEPLSSLDPNFREEIRRTLKKLHLEMGTTFLMVTHDFSEVLFLAGRTAIINQGRIEQVGNTLDIFQKPATAFVADFVGMKNIFPVILQKNRAIIGELEIELNKIVPPSMRFMAIRPEDIGIHQSEPQGVINAFPGTVIRIENNGFYHDLIVKSDQTEFRASITRRRLVDMQLDVDKPVFLSLNPSSIHVF